MSTKTTTTTFSSHHLLQVSFVAPVKVVDHTEYVIQVSLSGKAWQCQRRYKEFDELHHKLNRVNPDLPLPKLPPKKWFGNMITNFITERQSGLQTYVDALLLDPRWASMHILRAFFDTHRHMNDSQQDNSNAFGSSLSASNVGLPTQHVNGSNTAQMEAEALEKIMEKNDEIVERAEKLMVEIYAAPPVLDATAAAEQVEEVEDALSKRSDELAEAVAVYRDELSKINETLSNGNEKEEIVVLTGQEKEELMNQAQSLVEGFRQETLP